MNWTPATNSDWPWPCIVSTFDCFFYKGLEIPLGPASHSTNLYRLWKVSLLNPSVDSRRRTIKALADVVYIDKFLRHFGFPSFRINRSVVASQGLQMLKVRSKTKILKTFILTINVGKIRKSVDGIDFAQRSASAHIG
jgi:hypothetical protein